MEGGEIHSHHYKADALLQSYHKRQEYSNISPNGIEEMQGIATRLVSRYPSLLLSSTATIVTNTSPQERAINSRNAFVHGLLQSGVKETQLLSEHPATCDSDIEEFSELRFFDVRHAS